MVAWGDMVSCGCCPVTGGIPTRMTEESFSRLCREKQRAAKGSDSDAPYANKIASAIRKKLNICADCRGKMRPPELKIIEKERMMAEKQVQQCDCCGMLKSVTMCSGELLCYTCASLAGAVTKRPAGVAKMIAKRGMATAIIDALGDDQVRSNVPSTVDLAKALGLPDTAPWQVVELAALQTAANGEDAARAVYNATLARDTVINRLKRLLRSPDSTGNELVDQVEHLVAACAAADAVGNELDAADRRLEKLEAQFDRIRAALGGDGPIPVANLAGEVEKLAAAYRNGIRDMAESTRAIPAPQHLAAAPSLLARPIESFLLDLSLMVMRGEVIGLGPEFIGSMREALS